MTSKSFIFTITYLSTLPLFKAYSHDKPTKDLTISTISSKLSTYKPFNFTPLGFSKKFINLFILEPPKEVPAKKQEVNQEKFLLNQNLLLHLYIYVKRSILTTNFFHNTILKILLI